MLRAVRYAGRLRFRLEVATEALVRRDLAYLDTVKGDRVRHELERIFGEDRVAPVLELAQELGLLRAIHPRLALSETALKRLREDRTEPPAERDLVLLSALACSVPAEEHPGLIARLNMNARWARVVRDTGAARDVFDRLSAPELSASELHGLLRRLDLAALAGCALASDVSTVIQRLETYRTKLHGARTLLNGADLIALGVPEGPMVGDLLEEMLSARLDGELITAEDERRFVRCRLGPAAR